MKLDQKGRFAPPPRLEPAAQRVSETVASWKGVVARTHWELGNESIVDGADFYYGDEELGHLHLYSDAHVAFSQAMVTTLIQAGLGERFPWSRSFVVFHVGSERDVAHALWLFQLSYDRRSGASNEELMARIAEYSKKRSALRSKVLPHNGRATAAR